MRSRGLLLTHRGYFAGAQRGYLSVRADRWRFGMRRTHFGARRGSLGARRGSRRRIRRQLGSVIRLADGRPRRPDRLPLRTLRNRPRPGPPLCIVRRESPRGRKRRARRLAPITVHRRRIDDCISDHSRAAGYKCPRHCAGEQAPTPVRMPASRRRLRWLASSDRRTRRRVAAPSASTGVSRSASVADDRRSSVTLALQDLADLDGRPLLGLARPRTRRADRSAADRAPTAGPPAASA